MSNVFKQMLSIGLIFVIILLTIVISTVYYLINTTNNKPQSKDTTTVVRLDFDTSDSSIINKTPVELIKVFDTIKMYVQSELIEPKVLEPQLPNKPIVNDSVLLDYKFE